MVLAGAFSFTASAQIGDYLGPGILTRGASGVGSRGGQQVDLRFFAEVSGVYDSGLQPFSVDPQGNLVEINGLYGVQLTLGAYGNHSWRRANLGLNYSGSFYHYVNQPFYDGSNHNLALGYTYQKSKRITFDLRAIAGTSSIGTGSAGSIYGSYNPTPTDIVNQPTAQLFDNRMYYLQGSMDVNLIQSSRTSYTLGGDWYSVQRQSHSLAGVNGYALNGTVRHRLSKTRTIGLSYSHSHYDFPHLFGESDVNTLQANFSTSLGRRWTFFIGAGAYEVEVNGLQNVAVDPVIAALLGQSTTTIAFYRKVISPSGSASLTGQLGKTSSVNFSYSRAVTPGNGLYLTSRTESAMGSYSYSGIRKWNIGLNAGYSSLGAIGQNLQPYSAVTGGVGVTYALTRAIHVIGRYDARQQQIDLVGYHHTGYRATIGLGWSPGDIPLSLW